MIKKIDYFMAYIGIDTFNLSESKNVMHFDHRSYGIIFDVTCNRTEEVFQVFSENNFFNRSYFWIMQDDNFDHAYNLLSKQNINYDAEITLSIPAENNINNELMLYDVYNPSFKRGGKLNVTDKGKWSFDYGLNITLTQNKIDRRSNLNGLVLHAVVVATGIAQNETFLEFMESDEHKELDSQHVKQL